jgi:6-phosphogluconate dehydrogenase
MEIGIVGMGRMGAGIAERLRRAGFAVLGYDLDPAVSDVTSLEGLVESLASPRLLWVMVPAGKPTNDALERLAGLVSPSDILVDGGNSYYKQSLAHAEALSRRGLRFLDIGTSGGIWGLQNGFCLMVGGAEADFREAEPVLRALAPAGGYAHVGPSGAGHFTKMVHNAVEYAMLQAYAEGFELLQSSGFQLDLRRVASLWNHGGVVRSWLLELAERAFERDPALDGLRGYVEDSGEGRWAVIDAVERGVPSGVIAQSLFARFTSRQDDSFAMRVIAALRNEFGGHAVREA